MGYDFSPVRRDAGPFHLGAFSWPVLLEQFGTLFPVIHRGGQYYLVSGIDKRMPQGADYPRILSNDGFKVTSDEAKIMARMARNYVAIQRTLPDENASGALVDKGSITRDDLMNVLSGALSGNNPREVWPRKIREDFVTKFEQFAEWAEKSGGFSIG